MDPVGGRFFYYQEILTFLVVFITMMLGPCMSWSSFLGTEDSVFFDLNDRAGCKAVMRLERM